MFSAHKFMGEVFFQYMIWVIYTEQFRKKGQIFKLIWKTSDLYCRENLPIFWIRTSRALCIMPEDKMEAQAKRIQKKAQNAFNRRKKGGESQEQKFLHFQTFTIQLVNTEMVINFLAYPIL